MKQDFRDFVDRAPVFNLDQYRDDTVGDREPPDHKICTVPIAELLRGERAKYLIKGVLPAKGIAAIYGPSASGKTFLTLDVALAIARGGEWFGHRVAQVGVVYVAAEGETGIADRLRAALGDAHADVALEVVPCTVDLLRGLADLDALIGAIRSAEERIGPVRLVVIDTLARCMPGGDENTSDAMGAFLRNVDHLRRAIDGLALVVHHTGKDERGGARGHSSFFAALDACLAVSRNGEQRSFRVAKSRDGIDGEEHAFRLESVELGVDEDGDTITSCIVVPEDAAPVGVARSGRLPAGAKIGLDTLREAIADKGRPMAGSSSIPPRVRAIEEEDWRRQFYLRYGSDDGAADTKRRAFLRAKQDLVSRGLVMMSAPYVWVVGK